MKPIEPVHVRYGDGPLQAAVLSPVLPAWDEGRFFEPLVRPLVDAGYRVTIYDTLSLLSEQPERLDAFAARWSALLAASGRIDLLAGGALGGAVVQAMLGAPWVADVPKVLLISAPSLADETLNTRLGALAELGRRGDVAHALTMLDSLVAPEGAAASPVPAAPPAPGSRAAEAARLARGFALLHDIDVRAAVDRYAGRLLNVYGERSQLVRRGNIHLRDTPAQAALGIPNGGMRPLTDDLVRVCAAVRAHLDIAVPQPHLT
ncbi:hypothetical protein [Burkholderia ubonensis]|uniref:Alpha/beta hydrolase n=1 Tax=Burkholderia ubonensis subsp. mesacidophila TaxID=265293 RepID=A0A2A4EMN5_9BURK|nr:hypothetical protein [Burkholderia ubonensis]PCE21650.1 hypothetical protein BZL54_34510 [Burkholderia ubonensis subsp. mesacidophila]